MTVLVKSSLKALSLLMPGSRDWIPGSTDTVHIIRFLKVEPYSIHGSFSKLEYLKIEFNEDSDTYAIVKVTSHSYIIMVNLSINDYFEVMRTLKEHIWMCFVFWQNVKTYPLLENESTI